MKEPTLASSSTTSIRISSLLRLEAGNGDGRVPKRRTLQCSIGQRVLQPVGVVSPGEVRSVMRTAAFLAGQRAGHDGLRNVQEGLEFQGLDQIAVEDLPTVLKE